MRTLSVALKIIMSFWFMSSFVNVGAQSLSDAVAAAQVRDPALRSASLNQEAARLNVWIAGSRLLPQVSYQEIRQNTNQTTTQDTVLGPSVRDYVGQSYNKQISLRQGIIRPRDVEGYRQGHIQSSYGQNKFISAQADLWTRAVGAWLDVLGARDLVGIYGGAVKSAQESSRQEGRRFELGDGTKDSRAEALAQLNLAKAMLLDAELNLKAKEKAYELLTGLLPEAIKGRRLPDENSVKLEAGLRDDLWSLILETAPELRAAQDAQDVSLSRSRQLLYDHFPTLDFVASATSAQNDSINTFGYHYTNRQVGAQLVVPLFLGGGVEASRRQAYATYEASVADREALLMRMENQFLGDWASQSGLQERTQAARSLVAAAKEQRRSAELGLSKGLRTWTDLSNADLLLARRTSELINLQLTLYKTQARILSLLPVQTPAWQDWINNLETASLQ